MSVQVYVRCGDCRGIGQVIHARLTEALSVVPRSPTWITTQEAALLVGIGATNMANLLRRLHRSKHVQRRGSGARYSPYEWTRP